MLTIPDTFLEYASYTDFGGALNGMFEK